MQLCKASQYKLALYKSADYIVLFIGKENNLTIKFYWPLALNIIFISS